ncbi:MAG: hypothetical protein QNK03_10890 [Myxococcota bacterium]|nr:hypothetical protein [Myxococcota bacterium]
MGRARERSARATGRARRLLSLAVAAAALGIGPHARAEEVTLQFSGLVDPLGWSSRFYENLALFTEEIAGGDEIELTLTYETEGTVITDHWLTLGGVPFVEGIPPTEARGFSWRGYAIPTDQASVELRLVETGKTALERVGDLEISANNSYRFRLRFEEPRKEGPPSCFELSVFASDPTGEAFDELPFPIRPHQLWRFEQPMEFSVTSCPLGTGQGASRDFAIGLLRGDVIPAPEPSAAAQRALVLGALLTIAATRRGTSPSRDG